MDTEIKFIKERLEKIVINIDLSDKSDIEKINLYLDSIEKKMLAYNYLLHQAPAISRLERNINKI